MRKTYLRWTSIAIVISIIGLLVQWGWVPEKTSTARCSFQNNAAWISVDWTSNPNEDTLVHELADNAKSRQIRYPFPFTTFITPDGTFSPSYRYATSFVSPFRRFNQETLLLAWIGIPLKNARQIGVKGWVDLADPVVRKQIVVFVKELIGESGFDGVHLNVETVQNNDQNFLRLLDELRQTIGKSQISIAGSHWVPDAVNALPFVHDFRWTSAYYRQVASRVDQIATMTYDSYMPTPELYRLWMREQVHGINRSVAGTGVELLIGVSVSREKTLSHNPQSENIKNGLPGICAGLSENSEMPKGVALYADWEFSSSDWDAWRHWSSR